MVPKKPGDLCYKPPFVCPSPPPSAAPAPPNQEPPARPGGAKAAGKGGEKGKARSKSQKGGKGEGKAIQDAAASKTSVKSPEKKADEM